MVRMEESIPHSTAHRYPMVLRFAMPGITWGSDPVNDPDKLLNAINKGLINPVLSWYGIHRVNGYNLKKRLLSKNRRIDALFWQLSDSAKPSFFF